MLTELEKIEHLKRKYHNSKRLYTVYQRSGEQGRYTFTLIYGTDSKKKAISFVHKKELEGLFVIAYCARAHEQVSRCVHVSGMRTSLQPSWQASPSVQTASTIPNTEAPQAPSEAPGVKLQTTKVPGVVKGGV